MNYKALEREKDELYNHIRNLKAICSTDFHLSVDCVGKHIVHLVGSKNHNRKPTVEELTAFEGIKAALLPLLNVYQNRYDEIERKLNAVNELLK